MADNAERARHEIIADLIAVRGHLIEPYPDDPRWTPWTRFVERALKNVDALAAELDATTKDAEKQKAGWDACIELLEAAGTDYQREKARAVAAEKRTAELKKTLSLYLNT